jgi:hypothetical protein
MGDKLTLRLAMGEGERCGVMVVVGGGKGRQAVEQVTAIGEQPLELGRKGIWPARIGLAGAFAPI